MPFGFPCYYKIATLVFLFVSLLPFFSPLPLFIFQILNCSYIYIWVCCQLSKYQIQFNRVGFFFLLKKSAACGNRAEKSGRWAHLNGPDDLIRKLSLMGHMILILVWVLYTQIFLYQVKVNIVISRRKRHRFRISLGKVKAGRRRPQLASLKQRTLSCPKSLPICNGTWPSQAFHTWVFQFSNSHLTLSLFF